MSEPTSPDGTEPNLGVGSWFWIQGIPFQIVKLSTYYNKPPKLVALSSSEILLLEQGKPVPGKDRHE